MNSLAYERQPKTYIPQEMTCTLKGQTIQYNLHLVSLIVEQLDSEAALINLEQFKGVVIASAGFGRYLYPSLVSVPRCDGGSEWRNVETVYAVQVHSSGLPAFADTVQSCVGPLISRVICESCCTWNYPHWRLPSRSGINSISLPGTI